MLYTRIILSQIQDALKYFPVVLITGARQVGKSTIALSLMDNYIILDDITAYSSAKADPQLFIENIKKPVVIDEIQKIPELLKAIKIDVDRNRINGNYLLTGSSNILAYKDVADTLAGRIAIFELMPLSCKEIFSKNEDVIEILLSGKLNELSPASISNEILLNQIIKGGYPEVQKIDTKKGRYIWFSSYIRTYIERDVRDIGELRNIDKFIRVYNILAPRSGNMINKSDISRDASVDIKTLDNYIELLKMVYQVFLLKPYSKNIGKRFSKTEKIFFTDSGILSHLLGISSVEDLMNSHYKGSIFETFVFVEILKAVKYSQKPLDLYFYRTSDGKEIGFIVESGSGIIAIEVKFSQTVTINDFKHIVYLKKSDPKFKAGYVLYMGTQILPFGENLFALPAGILF